MKLNPKSILIVLKMFELSLPHVWVILHSLNLVKKMSFFYHSAPFPVFCTLKMKCFLLYNRNWGPWASVSCPLYHGYYQWKNNVRCLFSVYWYLASCILYICKSMVINIFSLSLSLSPERRQAIIWTNAGILLTGPLGTKFSEILIEI